MFLGSEVLRASGRCQWRCLEDKLGDSAHQTIVSETRFGPSFMGLTSQQLMRSYYFDFGNFKRRNSLQQKRTHWRCDLKEETEVDRSCRLERSGP